eukprot:c19010_g1_i1 orf=351-956(-)
MQQCGCQEAFAQGQMVAHSSGSLKYIVGDFSDVQLNQVATGALDCLHYELDPYVCFDGDKKLWVYFHTDKDEEDSEGDRTASTKRWKKCKKALKMKTHVSSHSHVCVGDCQDPCVMELDFGSPSYFGGTDELPVYSVGRPDLVYDPEIDALASPQMVGNGFTDQVQDGMPPFIDLSPSLQLPCVNLQQSYSLGWEVLGSET